MSPSVDQGHRRYSDRILVNATAATAAASHTATRLMSALFDEGAGDLESNAFQEALDNAGAGHEPARRTGLQIPLQEHELGVQALAVPLRNVQGDTVAALNVVAAPHRWTQHALQNELLPVLLAA